MRPRHLLGARSDRRPDHFSASTALLAETQPDLFGGGHRVRRRDTNSHPRCHPGIPDPAGQRAPHHAWSRSGAAPPGAPRPAPGARLLHARRRRSWTPHANPRPPSSGFPVCTMPHVTQSPPPGRDRVASTSEHTGRRVVQAIWADPKGLFSHQTAPCLCSPGEQGVARKISSHSEPASWRCPRIRAGTRSDRIATAITGSLRPAQ